MANLTFFGLSGITQVYATIVSEAGQWWNGASFENYNGSRFAYYAIGLAEQGSSGVYVGACPALANGVYEICYWSQQGGSVAATDPKLGADLLEWNGTQRSYRPAGFESFSLANLDAAVSGVAASVWTVGTRTLTSFGSLVTDVSNDVLTGLASAVNHIGDLWTNYTSARAAKLDNLDAASSAIKAQTDKLQFDGSDNVKAAVSGFTGTVDVSDASVSAIAAAVAEDTVGVA